MPGRRNGRDVMGSRTIREGDACLWVTLPKRWVRNARRFGNYVCLLRALSRYAKLGSFRRVLIPWRCDQVFALGAKHTRERG